MSAMVAIDDFFEEATERRMDELGLRRVLGVVKGEPVWFGTAVQDQVHMKSAWKQRLDAEHPWPDSHGEVWATLRRLEEMPHVSTDEIIDAGFVPRWD